MSTNVGKCGDLDRNQIAGKDIKKLILQVEMKEFLRGEYVIVEVSRSGQSGR